MRGTWQLFSISLQLRPRLTTIKMTNFLVNLNYKNQVKEVNCRSSQQLYLPPLYYHHLFASTLIIDIKSREVIVVCLNNYIYLTSIILHISFMLTSATAHTSITEFISFLLGNTRNKILIAVATAAT